MSELFLDLGVAQCRLVFGCSLFGLRFLHGQGVFSTTVEHRVVQDSVD